MNSEPVLYRGWSNALGEPRLDLHLIDCLPFPSIRRVGERSLSSILRSRLLTTLINNDLSGKVNAGGCVSALDKFDVMQMCFACESAEKKTVSEKPVNEKI